jgi:hypothetical protein
MTFGEYTSFIPHLKNAKSPVFGDFLTDYINRKDVREAMNIPSNV